MINLSTFKLSLAENKVVPKKDMKIEILKIYFMTLEAIF